MATIAARQHGAIALRQLEGAGMSRAGVARRVRAGRLHRVHQGVYAVGHPGLSREGRWMAAVLALGTGAVLSHMSAAALWGLLRPEGGPVDVSVPSRSGRSRRRGIRVHRCASLAAAPRRADGFELPPLADPAPLVTVRRGIPVTAVPRTLDDLRATAPPRLVRRATRQAQLAGYALPTAAAPSRTRSDLEDAFLALVRRHRLPEPRVNVRVGRWTVDFLWPSHRLVVETDGEPYHRGSVSFEDDHQRDLDLRRRGYTVRRYTGAQLRDHPALIVAELGDVLRREPGVV